MDGGLDGAILSLDEVIIEDGYLIGVDVLGDLHERHPCLKLKHCSDARFLYVIGK